MTFDPEAFRAFERAGWETLGASYLEVTRSSTALAAVPLVDAVGVRPGMRVLDVACGPGYSAGEAARRGAEATGIDFAPSMLEQARREHPAARFQEGDAEALAFADASFDAVVCAFGILHFARPEQAMAEAFRVLAPGGRYAFTVWSTPDRVETFGIFRGAVAAHGTFDVPLPEGPPMFRFSDPAECTAALAAAGFVEAGTQEIGLVRRIAPAAFLDSLTKATVRTRALVAAQTPEAQARIRQAILDEATRRAVDGVVELRMPAVLAFGRKPG